MFKDKVKFIDLTHTITPSIPTWGGECGFVVNTVADYAQGCRVQHFNMCAGLGTHMDAPAHFIPNADDIAAIPLERLIVPVHVINISHKCSSDYFATPGDMIEYENNYGTISESSLVIFYSGWDKYWDDQTKYRNMDENGVMHFPGILPTTASLLVERNIAGIAIDTLSPDGSNYQFPVHQILLGNDKYIIENIARAKSLPVSGAHAIALPLKIAQGTESAIRIVGVISQ